jgi:hypothetical protein
MVRDASHQQAIEKFSFIYTLTLSSAVDSTSEAEELNVDRSRAIGRSLKVETSATKQQDRINDHSSSLVATAATASLISHREDITHSGANLAEIIAFSPSQPQSDRTTAKTNYLGKILLVLACGYSMFVLWWLFDSHSGRLLALLTGKKQVFISQSDAEFIDYAERSLAAIDRKIQANKKEDTPSESQVVYVPVYSPTTPTPTAPQLPNTSLTPPPLPLPDIAKIPAPPPLPEPTPLPQSAETPVVGTSVSKPTIKHTLIGILELGDKSAALFEIDGTTKRVWLGEKIDGSDWILESVDHQQAKVSDGGNIRSLSVGETF